MSNLTQFAPFAGGGLKSLQTGYVNGTSSSSTGEDARYFDVTVSAVVIAKSIPDFQGNIGYGGGYYFYADQVQTIATIRLTSTTNLRVSSRDPTYSNANGRWYLAEAN